MASCSNCGYKRRTKKGYIILPCFKVETCKNCGEVEAVWGNTADIFFRYIFQYFWTGGVHITED